MDRRFWAIFVLSLALHAAALVYIQTRPHVPAVTLPPILASLRIAVSAYASPSTGPTAEPRTAATPAVVPQQARQLPPRRERLSTRGATEAATPPVAAAAASRQASEPAAPPAPAAAAANAAPDLPPAAAPAQAQGSLLDAYRQRLTKILAGQQQYPRVAAQRGWEGEVRLRLRVARKGNLLAVQLDHSSGFDVLDQHALAMLEQIAPLPALPEGLEASEIQVVVPVNYRLKKTT